MKSVLWIGKIAWLAVLACYLYAMPWERGPIIGFFLLCLLSVPVLLDGEEDHV